MSEVYSAGDPVRADGINAGSDCNRMGISRSTVIPLAQESSFSSIVLVSIALAIGGMQSGDSTDRVKTSSYGTAKAQSPGLKTGFLRIGCSGRRLLALDGRLRQSQHSLRPVRIADGLGKNSFPRLVAALKGGRVELLFYPHSDMHTRGLRLCSK